MGRIAGILVLIVAITLIVGGIRTLRRKDEGGRPFGIIELVIGLLALGALAIDEAPSKPAHSTHLPVLQHL